MSLFDYDAYTSLTRFIDRDEALVMIDIGANEGVTIRRMLDEFPRGTVYAFEPAPETYQLLCRNVAGDGRVRTFALAAGSRNGTVDFHVTENNWCSSVLQPSNLGKRYYGDWYNTRRTVQARVVRLDDWAKGEGVERVDFLKVDAQGYDLEVLKGAEGLLRSGVRALNCEFQFAPEYEGCASYSQIDQFLVGCGFALHQMHEVWSKGDEQQTTCGDGLWLRTDVLAALRSRKNLHEILTPHGRLDAALNRLAARGLTKVALFGAGRHTQRIARQFDSLCLPIDAIIDDNRALRGTRVGGRPVITPGEAVTAGFDAVVLSSDAHEPALWENSAGLREAGIEVVPLYRRYADAAAGVQGASAFREPSGIARL